MHPNLFEANGFSMYREQFHDHVRQRASSNLHACSPTLLFPAHGRLMCGTVFGVGGQSRIVFNSSRLRQEFSYQILDLATYLLFPFLRKQKTVVNPK